MTPQEQWLIDREEWKALLREMWYLQQEEEPSIYSGKSVLIRWLDNFKPEGETGWTCCVPLENETWCGRRINHLDRAIAHVRGHLGLRPYPCEGQCGKEIWYAECRRAAPT